MKFQLKIFLKLIFLTVKVTSFTSYKHLQKEDEPNKLARHKLMMSNREN